MPCWRGIKEKGLEMNRRGFLRNGAKVAVGAAVVSQLKVKSAFAAAGEQVNVTSEIGRNHGHSLDLDVADVVKLVRKTETSDGVAEVLSIQGASGHPHSISLTQTDLMSLLVGEDLMLSSSVDAGHAHSVLVRMTVEAV